MAGTRMSGIADTALTSYLTGQQDGQEWALLDNLDADEARDVAKAAITMLREANRAIAVCAVATDPMAERVQRLRAADASRAFIEPYLEALAIRFGEATSDSTTDG